MEIQKKHGSFNQAARVENFDCLTARKTAPEPRTAKRLRSELRKSKNRGLPLQNIEILADIQSKRKLFATQQKSVDFANGSYTENY